MEDTQPASKQTFYQCLGVEPTATKDEIKKAYRTLQMKYHPDKNQSAEAHHKTQEINEAYETLGDDQKKAEYDFQQSNPNPFLGGFGGGEVNIQEMFNMMFRSPGQPIFKTHSAGRPTIHVFHSHSPHGHSQNAQPNHPFGPFGPFPFGPFGPNPLGPSMDILCTQTVSLEQAYTGTSYSMEIERWILENGIKVFEKEVIVVELPAGIDHNEVVVLREKGNILSEHHKGDIKITILVEQNKKNMTPSFQRSGLDLLMDKTITLKDALCGFSFDLKHLNGKTYTMTNKRGKIVPAEYKKIYPDMGMVRGEHRGNLVIQFHVQFPETLTEDQMNTLAEIL